MRRNARLVDRSGRLARLLRLPGEFHRLGVSSLPGVLLLSGLFASLAWCSNIAAAADDSLEQRRERFEKMTPQQLADLVRKKERFDQLPPEQQSAVRQLHAELSAEANESQLRSVLTRYHAWLQTLTAAQRAELLSLPADERMKQIRKLQDAQKQDQQRFVLPSPGSSLPDADVATLLAWFDQLLARVQPQILDQSPRTKEFLDKTSDPRQRRWILMMAVGRPRGENRLSLLTPTQEEIDALREQLSPPTRTQFDAAQSRDKKQELVQDWLRSAMFQQFRPTAEELERFYREELTASEREWLDPMPRERFLRELGNMYRFRASGGQRPSFGGRPPFGGGSGGGPGPTLGPGPGGSPNGQVPPGPPRDRDRDRGDRDYDRDRPPHGPRSGSSKEHSPQDHSPKDPSPKAPEPKNSGPKNAGPARSGA